jgi:hypothetical protein
VIVIQSIVVFSGIMTDASSVSDGAFAAKNIVEEKLINCACHETTDTSELIQVYVYSKIFRK